MNLEKSRRARSSLRCSPRTKSVRARVRRYNPPCAHDRQPNVLPVGKWPGERHDTVEETRARVLLLLDESAEVEATLEVAVPRARAQKRTDGRVRMLSW